MAFEVATIGFKVASLFSADYDGGEFCKGLVAAKEGSTVIFKAANMIMNPPKSVESTPLIDNKKLALETKLH